MSNTAPYTQFGKTKALPVKIYTNGNYVDDTPEWDLEMWIERGEDWYAFSSKSLKGKRVRVVTREDWLRCKE